MRKAVEVTNANRKIASLTPIFSVFTELLGEDAVTIRAARKSGPTSKVQKVFDEVARLPRRQQEKIVEVVSALMTQYEQNR